MVPYDKRTGKIWYNSELVDWADAKIHVLNHGLHYASCVFEGERVYDGSIFKLEEHTSRLFYSAKRMSQYFKIGKLAASHGLLGDLILQHHLGKKTALKGLETIYIQDATDNFIPYFIEKATARSSTETLLKLEEINDKEAARLLTPKEVWLESADFNKHAAKSTPISMLGFTLFDQEVELGEIIEVIEQPHQVLCCILYKGKEALIPIHEESVEKIDKKNIEEFFNSKKTFLEKFGNNLPLDLKPDKPFVPEIKEKPLKMGGKVAVIIPTKGKSSWLFARC